MNPSLVDSLFELACPQDSRAAYWRALVRACEKYGWTTATAVKEGNQVLFRRGIRYAVYTGPAEAGSRTRRDGLAWTWFEDRMVDWVLRDVRSPHASLSDVEYIALMLQRTPAEVCDELRRRVIECNGVRGFDLES